MWLQQKMVTPPVDRPSAAGAKPDDADFDALLFAFMTLTFPSGLALYWVASNVISIVMQYFISGWGGLADMFGLRTR